MVEFEDEVFLTTSERANAFVSGIMLGSAVGILLNHGIPVSAAIAFILPGVTLAAGEAIQYKLREKNVMRQRFVEGA
jgi:F0F1-type ATP synthase assembly protein I